MSVFGRRILGRPPDAYRLTLGYHLHILPSTSTGRPGTVTPPHCNDESPSPSIAAADADDPTARSFESVVEWTDSDSEAAILERLRGAGAVPELLDEYVVMAMTFYDPDRPGGMVNASAPSKLVLVDLRVERTPVQLRKLEIARTTPSGTLAPPLLASLLLACELHAVTRLKCGEGCAAAIWDEPLLSRLTALRSLSLNNCGLTALPAGVRRFTGLRELRVAGNKLAVLPKEVGQLRELRKLAADQNLLTTVPVELRFCTQLAELSLEGNKLTTPVLDLRALSRLQSLQLFGNPLDFLPELSPCSELRHLSLANVRVRADQAWSQWEVEVLPTGYMARGHRLSPLFNLIFRRSSCNHPLLAGALGRLAEDPANCELMAKEEGAVPQVLVMALSDSEVVVEQACRTIASLARNSPAVAGQLLDVDVLAAMVRLVAGGRPMPQLAALRVLAALALASEAAAQTLLTPELLALLRELVLSGTDELKSAALEAMGNLAFCPANANTLAHMPGLRTILARLARSQPGAVRQRVRVAAIRTLAILGENEEVRQAVGRPPLRGRGVRILAMDGGGMKGLATVAMLRQLEARAGRRIHELFDLICGTSTGGILAVSLALKRFTLDECEDIYRSLGRKVFSRPLKDKEGPDGWRESLYRVYKSGQQSMRVAVYGCKHDAAMFEALLKQFCTFRDSPQCLGDAMIDTACTDGPKCFVVSTRASMTPAEPFLFRNYQHPRGCGALAAQLHACEGSAQHLVWQAVRASSAAPYYLDDFNCGADRFQDGAATANNPAAIALQEARLLWPDTPIECLVSLGSGSVPTAPRGKSVSAYLDTGSVLIESACNVERVDAVLATLLPLIPDLHYFRFNPMDPRCGIELDEIDPAQWAQLEAATADYIEEAAPQLEAAAQLLVSGRGPASGANAAAAAPPDRLGSRRLVLLIEAPRSAEEGATQQVQAVAEAVARLPRCVERCHLAAASASSDGELRRPLEIMSERLLARAGEVGVVHLALHSDEEGLIDSWHQSLEAVVEPSARASELVAQAAAAPSSGGSGRGKLTPTAASYERSGCAASLGELCTASPSFVAGGQYMRFISRQTHQMGDDALSSYLFQRTQPASRLSSAKAASMIGVWEQQLVVCSAAVPQPLALALLQQGAKAVVCLDSQTPDPRAADAAAFFAAFYGRLFGGASVLESLAAAGAAVPALAHSYLSCMLVDGKLVAAEAAPVAADSGGPAGGPEVVDLTGDADGESGAGELMRSPKAVAGMARDAGRSPSPAPALKRLRVAAAGGVQWPQPGGWKDPDAM